MTLTRLSVLTAVAFTAASAQEGLTWLDHYPRALEQAKATGKPIFLEYRCEP